MRPTANLLFLVLVAVRTSWVAEATRQGSQQTARRGGRDDVPGEEEREEEEREEEDAQTRADVHVHGQVAILGNASRSQVTEEVLPTTPPADAQGEVLRRLERLGVPPRARCRDIDLSGNVGCAALCHCAWSQQCYIKYFVLTEVGGTAVAGAATEDVRRFNVGVCETSLVVLAAISILVFVAALTIVIGLRMYLQWRESLVLPARLYAKGTCRRPGGEAASSLGASPRSSGSEAPPSAVSLQPAT